MRTERVHHPTNEKALESLCPFFSLLDDRERNNRESDWAGLGRKSSDWDRETSTTALNPDLLQRPFAPQSLRKVILTPASISLQSVSPGSVVAGADSLSRTLGRVTSTYTDHFRALSWSVSEISLTFCQCHSQSF